MSSDHPLPSLHNLSDDSGSEEDPTIESKHRSDTFHSAVLEDRSAVVNCYPATTECKLSAASRISMALSNPSSLLKSQSDPDIRHRDIQVQNCHLAPTTKISMALSAQTSKIGRRLSTMLHNSRLRQRSSTSAGMIHFFLLFVKSFVIYISAAAAELIV